MIGHFSPAGGRSPVGCSAIITDRPAEACLETVIEILVSPLVDKNALRIMDLSWDVGPQWRQADWVGLYDQPPYHLIQPVFRFEAKDAVGSVRTGIQEGRIFLEPDYQKKCLGWWAAYWHKNQSNPVAVSCLSTNPRWMEEMMSLISSLKVNEAFVPGTHNSGSFHLAYKPFFDNRIAKYVFNQDESIMEQLIHGARYLDLRVGLFDDGHFWVCHGIARVHPLEYILGDIKIFVENTNEIVILDFHEFRDGFNDHRVHHRLVDFIRNVLGEHLAPPYLGWGTTFGQLWRIGKRVIAAYNDVTIVRERPTDVWWPVKQFWGDKRTLQDLYYYFKDIFTRGVNTRGVFWSAMAELTPNSWDVILDKKKGLRKMADEVNRDVTKWFRGSWGATANGVAVDFIRSTGIVEAAINWNKRKAKRSLCD